MKETTMKKPISKGRKMNKWFNFKEGFVIVEEGLFNKNELITIPVKVFMNQETGEVRMFGKNKVEELGLEKMIEILTLKK